MMSNVIFGKPQRFKKNKHIRTSQKHYEIMVDFCLATSYHLLRDWNIFTVFLMAHALVLYSSTISVDLSGMKKFKVKEGTVQDFFFFYLLWKLYHKFKWILKNNPEGLLCRRSEYLP